MLVEMVDLEEGVEVQWVGVYVLKWQREWGHATAGFREVEHDPTELQPCGHPVACLASSHFSTYDGELDTGEMAEEYCRWCASLDQARAEERERYQIKAGNLRPEWPDETPEVTQAFDDFIQSLLYDGEPSED